MEYIDTQEDSCSTVGFKGLFLSYTVDYGQITFPYYPAALKEGKSRIRSDDWQWKLQWTTQILVRKMEHKRNNGSKC